MGHLKKVEVKIPNALKLSLAVVLMESTSGSKTTIAPCLSTYLEDKFIVGGNNYFFIDEVQEVKEFERTLRICWRRVLVIFTVRVVMQICYQVNWLHFCLADI
ncbi:hypothetical protein SAMN05661012_05951 [Chitinophaga sancti]|uniref:Uncharacterized protein n=1 Tax=Chitinophaga sancti TaxID=1004 RepID=A0A1K1SS27_9BACT|nr:hypothetical protein SAMN05661012_05951 [Chitinophaga sancti]